MRIVAQGSEAGGHARGRVPLHVLLATIRHKWPDMLLLGAGGISDRPPRRLPFVRALTECG